MRGAAVVCLLVVLAGCNGQLGAGGTPSPAATATPTPAGSTTPTATPAPDPADVGLAADGVVNATLLARAHERQLNATSYTLGTAVVVRGPDGTVLVRYRRVVRVAPGGDRFVWNASADVAEDAPGWVRRRFRTLDRVRAYSNRTATFVTVVVDGERDDVRYSDRTDQQYFLRRGRSLDASDLVQETFGSVDTRVTRVERVDGTVRYRLAAADGPHEFALSLDRNVTVDVLSLSATVQRTGVVRRLVLRYAVETPRGRYTVRRVLTVVDVGTTAVEEPPWVAGIRANTSARPGRTVRTP